MAASRPTTAWQQRAVVQQSAQLPPPPPPLLAPLGVGTELQPHRLSARRHQVPRAAAASLQMTDKAAPGPSRSAAGLAAGDSPDMVAAAEAESLELLEWPSLCRQVACFAQTPMGAELALRCALPVGRSRLESEQLLRQTAEAQQAQLE